MLSGAGAQNPLSCVPCGRGSSALSGHKEHFPPSKGVFFTALPRAPGRDAVQEALPSFDRMALVGSARSLVSLACKTLGLKIFFHPHSGGFDNRCSFLCPLARSRHV